MSDTVINWRFWHWHFQVRRWGDWPGLIKRGRSPVTLFPNEWHRGLGSMRRPLSLAGDQDPAWRRIEFYEGKPYLIFPLMLIALAIWVAL